MGQLTWEQTDSALHELRRSGFRRGDVSEVLVVAGSVPNAPTAWHHSHFAFCPGVIHVIRVVKRGPRFQRYLPLDGSLLFEHEEDIARKIMGQRGFAVMRGQVLAVQPGIIGFDMDPEFLKVIASPTGYLRDQLGKEEAGNILREELKLLGV